MSHGIKEKDSEGVRGIHISDSYHTLYGYYLKVQQEKAAIVGAVTCRIGIVETGSCCYGSWRVDGTC